MLFLCIFVFFVCFYYRENNLIKNFYIYIKCSLIAFSGVILKFINSSKGGCFNFVFGVAFNCDRVNY